MFVNRTVWLKLFSNNFSNYAVNNFSGAVENLDNFLDDSSAVAACAVTSFLSLLLSTTARSERDSHSGYEHKCNLFHFLFCFLIL